LPIGGVMKRSFMRSPVSAEMVSP